MGEEGRGWKVGDKREPPPPIGEEGRLGMEMGAMMVSVSFRRKRPGRSPSTFDETETKRLWRGAFRSPCAPESSEDVLE